MEDYEIVTRHLMTLDPSPSVQFSMVVIRAREANRAPTSPGRADYEKVSDALYQTAPPEDVTEAWCRIVARERARMGLPDPTTERTAAICYLAEWATVTAGDLVEAGAYANRETAAVVLATLERAGRIRRVERGVYALPVSA